jgi:hypothetical protein
MEKGIVINCIGIGHWGPNLVRALASHPDAQVGLVCDISEERLRIIQQNISARSSLRLPPRAISTSRGWHWKPGNMSLLKNQSA